LAVLFRQLACYKGQQYKLSHVWSSMGNEPKVLTADLLVSLAAFVIIIAGMKLASALLVPFLLAVFIAILIASPFEWLQGKGLPAGIALLLVLTALVIVMTLVGSLIGSSVQDFTGTFPVYEARLKEMSGGFVDWLAGSGIHISSGLLSSYADPGKAMKMAAEVLGSLGNMLANSFLILVTVVFLMLEAASFPAKWRAGHEDAEGSLLRFSATASTINRYMGIKALTSLATGLVVVILLGLIGVDYAVLWGVLAFLLNFIPNIGSIIAAIPAILLALVQLGVSAALAVAGGYLLINIVIGTFLEPRFMGKGLGLSVLVVFLSLVFWGWVLGPVGMLLSVPLTIAIKIALDGQAETRWIAILLGPKVEPVADVAANEAFHDECS
jgi:predicted PurR-regulated permease PerM